MKRFLLTLSLGWWATIPCRANAPATLPAPTTAPADYHLNDAPYNSLVEPDLTLHDAKRDKDLHVRIYYPDTSDATGKSAGPFPIIIFSHGAGGSKIGYAALATFWSDHGYVVILPDHADANAFFDPKHPHAALVDDEGAGGVMKKLGKILSDTPGLENRAADIVFVLDQLPSLPDNVDALHGKMDLQHIGVGGHSLGAYTADLVGGAQVNRDGKLVSFADPRPSAFLMLSAQGPGRMDLTEHSWDNFTRPLFAMTGTEDKAFAGEPPDWKLEPYKLSPPGDKYASNIQGANHMSFTGIEAKGLTRKRIASQGAGGQIPIFDDIKMASLAFWDAYLKNDSTARNYLQTDGLGDYSQGIAKIEHR